MALRLTTPDTSGVPKAQELLVKRLVAETITALQSQNPQGIRDALAEAGKVAGFNERYEARCAVVAEVLLAKDLPQEELQEHFTACLAGLLEALEENPLEPTFLNWVGIIFYELGHSRTAQAFFEATHRLDPERPHLASNLRETKRRPKSTSAGLRKSQSPAVQRRMGELVPAAERLAGKVWPRHDQTVSVVMIVKDEEEMLPRTLDAVVPWIDELIIVDTGSTDNTVEIAEAFGARVLHFPWTGDFSEARNVSLDAATCDWFFYLDADEVLSEGDGEYLQKLLTHTWREALSLVYTNYIGDVEQGTAVGHRAFRIFRNRPEYRFSGRVHEQIVNCVPNRADRREQTELHIKHYGYVEAVWENKSKAARNIELLKQQVKEGVDDAFVHFNLGTEYLALEEYVEADRHFAKAITSLPTDAEKRTCGFFPVLLVRQCRVLRSLGSPEFADELTELGLRLWPNFTDLVFADAVALKGKKEYAAAERRFREALEMGDAPTSIGGRQEGVGTYLAHLGVAEVCLAEKRYEEAAEHLREVMIASPTLGAAFGPYVSARLHTGAEYPTIRAEITEIVGEIPSSALFMMAVPFYERSVFDVAETLLRESLDRRSGAHHARLALVETLLSQSRFDEACEESLKIPAEAPIARLVAISHAFAAMLVDDGGERWNAAMLYAMTAEVEPAVLGMFRAWRAGQAAPKTIGAAAMPTIGLILTALARIEEFDQFGRLAVVTEGLDVPWRDRRELMALVYMDRGFLDSAADEWVTVVEKDGPDLRAAIGLARIAKARGMTEEAELFTSMAEELYDEQQRDAKTKMHGDLDLDLSAFAL